MIQILFVCIIFAYTVIIPSSAQAYLLPLIGAGGAIITMLIGLITALFSAIYLVFYNIRRALKKRMGNGAEEEDPSDSTGT